MFEFVPATKTQAKARIALIGPSGSGKTYTALKFAGVLGNKIALIDTENSSASKYAGDQDLPKFNVLNLTEYAPHTYVEAIKSAEKAGFNVLVIDSLSHAWAGKGGALEMVDKAAKKYRENSFAAWRDVTPHHNALVDALVQCSIHLIVTMRTKTEYVVETNAKGKQAPRRVGLAPVQRDGLEYEFDIVADIDLDHTLQIIKTRCKALDGFTVQKPGADVAQIIADWLGDGDEPLPPHWSGDQVKRQQIETKLSENGIPIEALFSACEVKDWSDMRRYEGTGKEAYNAAKEWKSNGNLIEADQPLTAALAEEEE